MPSALSSSSCQNVPSKSTGIGGAQAAGQGLVQRTASGDISDGAACGGIADDEPDGVARRFLALQNRGLSPATTNASAVRPQAAPVRSRSGRARPIGRGVTVTVANARVVGSTRESCSRMCTVASVA